MEGWGGVWVFWGKITVRKFDGHIFSVSDMGSKKYSERNLYCCEKMQGTSSFNLNGWSLIGFLIIFLIN